MRIRKSHFTSLAVSLMISGLCSAQDYIADGKALGNSQKQVMSGAVNETNATNTPFYNPNPAQASQFGGGMSLLNMGTQRISQCSGYVAGSDKMANQECEAVNFLAKNPSTRKHYTIDKTNDIFTAARNAIENPPSGGSGISGSGTDCVDKVVKQPDSYSKAFCDQWLIPEDKICTAPMNVTVSSASMFTCTDTLLQTTSEQCASVKYSDYRVDQYRSETKVPLTCGGDSTIQGWYQTYAGRCADVDGMNYWINIKNTPQQVNTYSAPLYPMNCGGDSTIQGWYQTYAGRCADAAGMDYWVAQLPGFQYNYSNMFGAWYNALQGGYPGGVTKDQYFCGSSGTLSGSQCVKQTLSYPTYSDVFVWWYQALQGGYPGGQTKDQYLCYSGGNYIYLTTQCQYQQITMIPTYQCDSLSSQTSTGSSMTYPVLIPSTCSGDPTIQSWYHQYDSRCADTAGMAYWQNQLNTAFGGNYSKMFDAWYTAFLGAGGRGSFWPSLCNQNDEYILDSTNCRKRIYSTGSNCQKQSSVCIDSTPTKVFSGISVSVSSVGGCWEYRDTYQCLRPLGASTCNAVAATPSCQQINQTCTTPAFNGSCAQQTRTFRCGDPNLPTPSGSTNLGQTPDITSSTVDNTQCVPYDKNAECKQYEDVCVEPNQTKVINGISVYQACWKWQRKYTCYSTDYTNDCQTLVNRTCINLNQDSCMEYTPAGRCALYHREYSCKTQDGVQTTVKDCGLRSFCSTDASGNQQCWDTSYQNDQDFLKAVVGMEAGREAGTYIDGSMRLFTGKGSHCSLGLVGIKNCCEESGGARSNHSVLNTVGLQTFKAVGQEAMNIGSKYMYDFMYPDMPWGQISGEALSDFSPAFTPTEFTPSVGAYGFTLSAGAAPTGSIVLAEGSIGGSTMTFAFDPTSFAIAIAIQVVIAVTTCDQDEKYLSMQKGAGLCHDIGPYCAKRFLGICIEKAESHCCFNSKLARILQEQGRPMIGKSWGGGENPDCSGFTIDEFSQIDFSKIDLSEFVNDIMGTLDMPDVDYIQTKMKQKMGN